MKINLREIPAEGRSYHLDRKTGELNEVLEDLIGQNRYETDFFIRPMGNAYELTGAIQTSVPEVCSRCGWDLDYKIQRKFHEILLEEKESPRNSQSVHGNQSVDFLADGPSVTSTHGDQFDAGDYFHELVAIETPAYPTCEEGKCVDIEEIERKKAELAESYQRASENQGHPAFSVLKNILPKS